MHACGFDDLEELFAEARTVSAFATTVATGNIVLPSGAEKERHPEEKKQSLAPFISCI